MVQAIIQPITKSRSPHHLWSDQKLLLGLFHSMIPSIRRGSRKSSAGNAYYWTYEPTVLIQKTLASWSLVCHEWNRVFTPLLYQSIVVGKTGPSLTEERLREVEPTHKALIRTIRVKAAEGVSTANILLGLIPGLPNLRELTLDGLVPPRLHPDFPKHISSLSKKCTVRLRYGEGYGGLVDWKLLPQWIKFIRRSGVAHCELGMHYDSSDGKYFFRGVSRQKLISLCEELRIRFCALFRVGGSQRKVRIRGVVTSMNEGHFIDLLTDGTLRLELLMLELESTKVPPPSMGKSVYYIP